MNVRFATDKERDNWDALLSRNPDGGNIFQSKELTEFKQRSGWTPRFLIIENFDKNKSLAIAIQEKRIFGLGTLWYACKGPGITNVAQLEKIIKPLQAFANRYGVFAVKMESEILKSPETIAEMKQLGLEIVRPIQPNYSTIVLDISPTKSEEELLRAMPKKGAKYAINRALRDGVIVEEVPCTSQNAHAFYDLWVETAQSAGFYIHDFTYHYEFWKTFCENNMGQLFFAKFQGQIVAGAFALCLEKKSTYKDGASVRVRKAYGASHLLQWRVIQWARKRGVTTHDLCGAPPSDRIHDKTHFLHGVGQFKTSFSKKVTDYVGAFDLVINARKYSVWRSLAERLLLRFYRNILRKNWY